MESNDREIWKEKLNSGFSDLTPDCWNEIRDALPELSDKEQPEQEKKAAKPVFVRFMPLVAAAAVILCMFTFVMKGAETVEKQLFIDVNPSVCISMNKTGRVISVYGINEDGCRVVDAVSEELDNVKDIDKAVMSIIAEIDQEGYFESGTLDALISLSYIESKDDSILDHVCKSIEGYAESRGLKHELIARSFARDEEAEEIASGMNISPGKYKYIVGLSDGKDTDRAEILELADKSTEEIKKYVAKAEKKEKAKKAERKGKGKPEKKKSEEDKTGQKSKGMPDKNGNKTNNSSSEKATNGSTKQTDKGKKKSSDKKSSGKTAKKKKSPSKKAGDNKKKHTKTAGKKKQTSAKSSGNKKSKRASSADND